MNSIAISKAVRAGSGWYWGAILLGLFSLTVTIWMLTSGKPTIQEGAKEYSKSIVTLDADRLYLASSNEERSALGLTKEKMRRFIVLFLAPRMKDVRIGQPIGRLFDQDNLQPVYLGLTLGPRMISGSAMIYASPDGPRASVIEDLVLIGANLDAVRAYPQGKDDMLFFQSLASLDRQISDLKATGLRGYYEAATGNVISWDVYAVRIRQLASHQLKSSQNLAKPR